MRTFFYTDAKGPRYFGLVEKTFELTVTVLVWAPKWLI